ncbi:hypothetical protein [Nocardiopsis lucentensis]|uniref:hypothetical protein n=1 Tax=Nocardiopsis lucentensis TaxID=53441 RepID=UPI00034CDDD9|nr:hypothetical protein [Nocardiopsis lucentensis]
MRLIPSTPLSCLGTAVVVVAVGGVALVGFGVIDLDMDLSLSSGDLDAFEGLPLGDPSGEPSTGPDAEETPDAPGYALPESCAAAGVAEVVGDLAPGPVLTEESGEVEGVDDAEQLVCSYGDGGAESGSPTFTVVFTLGADPSTNPDVVRVPGSEERMNWEVDVDVDVDTYHTDEADSLGGDLEYVGTVDGSSRHLYLALPGELHVTAISYFGDVPREDLERVVMTAAERIRN